MTLVGLLCQSCWLLLTNIILLSDNSDVYKQNKQGKQTLTRRSSQQDARPLRLKALFLKREREREREREKSTDGKSFRFSCELLRSQSRSIAGFFALARSSTCGRRRVRHESNRNRSGLADEVRNLPNERTNERTNIAQREEG